MKIIVSFVDQSIHHLVDEILENSENCSAQLPRAKDDVLKCCYMSTNSPQTQRYSMISTTEKQEIITLEKLKPESVSVLP